MGVNLRLLDKLLRKNRVSGNNGLSATDSKHFRFNSKDYPKVTWRTKTAFFTERDYSKHFNALRESIKSNIKDNENPDYFKAIKGIADPEEKKMILQHLYTFRIADIKTSYLYDSYFSIRTLEEGRKPLDLQIKDMEWKKEIERNGKKLDDLYRKAWEYDTNIRVGKENFNLDFEKFYNADKHGHPNIMACESCFDNVPDKKGRSYEQMIKSREKQDKTAWTDIIIF